MYVWQDGNATCISLTDTSPHKTEYDSDKYRRCCCKRRDYYSIKFCNTGLGTTDLLIPTAGCVKWWYQVRCCRTLLTCSYAMIVTRRIDRSPNTNCLIGLCLCGLLKKIWVRRQTYLCIVITIVCDLIIIMKNKVQNC